MDTERDTNIPFAFFGTDNFSVIILDKLTKAGFVPSLIVTAPDRRAGRGMKLTPPPAKVWAEKNKIPLLQPETFDTSVLQKLKDGGCELFVIAFYGKILPQEALDIPKRGTLNVHPSLLPAYRGPSPEQSQILDGVTKTGVTIILADNKMDHGPIVGKKEYTLETPYIQYKDLRRELSALAGTLLTEVLPEWTLGNIEPREQDHTNATYTKLLTKEDGLIRLTDDSETNYRKFLAYNPWPGTYFFSGDTRVKITDAVLEDGVFVVRHVTPEGKREMSYDDFLRTS
ncbi:MAG: methionyl-tRNA formyltransferase [Parcubacteria group bacterium]|nr:methionyl-tRNA formyltransferase [Parcubacteria group bacterium]